MHTRHHVFPLQLRWDFPPYSPSWTLTHEKVRGTLCGFMIEHDQVQYSEASRLKTESWVMNIVQEAGIGGCMLYAVRRVSK